MFYFWFYKPLSNLKETTCNYSIFEEFLTNAIVVQSIRIDEDDEIL
jgi:hypothetical protein